MRQQTALLRSSDFGDDLEIFAWTLRQHEYQHQLSKLNSNYVDLKRAITPGNVEIKFTCFTVVSRAVLYDLQRFFQSVFAPKSLEARLGLWLRAELAVVQCIVTWQFTGQLS